MKRAILVALIVATSLSMAVLVAGTNFRLLQEAYAQVDINITPGGTVQLNLGHGTPTPTGPAGTVPVPLLRVPVHCDKPSAILGGSPLCIPGHEYVLVPVP